MNEHIGIATTAQMIAAIPALIGFTPTESLITVALDHQRVICAARVNLDDADEMADNLTTTLSDNGANNAILVAVAADHTAAADTADRVALIMDARGLNVLRRVHTTAITPGTRWTDSNGTTGTVDDPKASALAAAQVTAGRTIATDRSEVEQSLDPIGPGITAEPDEGTNLDPVAATGAIRAALTQVENGHNLDTATVRTIGTLIQDPAVRDAALADMLGSRADAARAMWQDITRRLAGPARSAAAAIYAIGAYISGDGLRARVALDAATSTDPTNRIAHLVTAALDAGKHPEALRTVVTTVAEHTGTHIE